MSEENKYEVYATRIVTDAKGEIIGTAISHGDAVGFVEELNRLGTALLASRVESVLRMEAGVVLREERDHAVSEGVRIGEERNALARERAAIRFVLESARDKAHEHRGSADEKYQILLRAVDRLARANSSEIPNGSPAITAERLGEALDFIWNDHCGDAGCIPDCIKIHGPRTTTVSARFADSTFVTRVAEHLADISVSETAEKPKGAAADVRPAENTGAKGGVS